MESRAPAVVAVVVTTGSGPGLEATVASLVAQNYEELSLLVLANGEVEHVPERVATVAPNAFVRILEENRGYGAACNEAALMVEGSAFFLFCHDDVRLEPDAVQLMVEAAFRTNAGVVTPKVVSYDDPLVLLHVGQTCDRFGSVHERCELGEIDHGQQDLERDVFVAPGGVTLVRSDLFATLRGFDPLIPILGENLDLCWRAQIAGARIVVAPAAKVAHRETIATGERPVSSLGTRNASRQDLQRRHRLMVVASGWGRWNTVVSLSLLMVMDVLETLLALAGRDSDRIGAIVGSWRWLFKNRRHVGERRRQCQEFRVLSDGDLRRLQVGGASRLKRFILTLLRDGLDRARGILPEEADDNERDIQIDGVGFAAAFSEVEEFDEIPESPMLELRTRPSRFLTSFRSQVTVVTIASVLWVLGSRNLVAMHLPIVGRLAPLDSWWSMWRHFFASWSSSGVGTGTPGMPGYGVLGVAGTFVFGRMGILPRLALILSVPVGAIGVSRFLRGRVSNRARVIASVAYLGLPTGLNMIGGGRVDVLMFVGLAPYIVRRLFEILNVPGFRLRDYDAPVPFGHRGWRTTEAGQRMVLVMLTALVTAMAPAALVVVALVVAGVAIARYFEPDAVSVRGSWRILGSLIFNVAIFLLPLSVDVVLAGRRALEVFGLARGPWSAPSFADLARAVDGGFGAGWVGWLLPGAAVLSLVLCRGERHQIATKVGTIAALTLIVATLDAHHWMGSFAPDLDILLALYALMLVVIIGIGISALENDLRQVGFGWRQVSGAVLVGVLIVAVVPFATSFASGRFDLPTTSVAESLSTLSPSTYGGYRVLWIGDPSVVPIAGWSVAPGVEAATSMNGLPGGTSLFAPPDSGTTDVLLSAVSLALQGKTVRLGQLLAPAGISTIVVMNAAAPELSGVQGVPLRPVPSLLLTELSRQTDLSLVLQTKSVEVFSNALFRGIVSMTPTGSTTSKPVFPNGVWQGPLTGGSTVVAGLAPAGAFALEVNGTAVARSTNGTWTPFYGVRSSSTKLTGKLVLHQFPLNGVLALFTLSMWAVVWLGFGWIQRLEWLFTGRRRDRAVARHRRSSKHD